MWNVLLVVLNRRYIRNIRECELKFYYILITIEIRQLFDSKVYFYFSMAIYGKLVMPMKTFAL